jgi:hypothetical protein
MDVRTACSPPPWLVLAKGAKREREAARPCDQWFPNRVAPTCCLLFDWSAASLTRKNGPTHQKEWGEYNQQHNEIHRFHTSTLDTLTSVNSDFKQKFLLG